MTVYYQVNILPKKSTVYHDMVYQISEDWKNDVCKKTDIIQISLFSLVWNRALLKLIFAMQIRETALLKHTDYVAISVLVSIPPPQVLGSKGVGVKRVSQ